MDSGLGMLLNCHILSRSLSNKVPIRDTKFEYDPCAYEFSKYGRHFLQMKVNSIVDTWIKFKHPNNDCAYTMMTAKELAIKMLVERKNQYRSS